MAAKTKDRSVYYNARYSVLDTTRVSPFSQFSVTRKMTRTRLGEGCPDWKNKIRTHSDATTSLDGEYNSSETVGFINASCEYLWTPGVGFGGTKQRIYVNGDFAAYENSMSNGSFAWDSSVEGRAANKFLSEVRRTVTSMSAPTFLGEIRQTIRMLRHPLQALEQSIDRYYRELSKRKFAEQRRRRRKGPPSKYLKWEWEKALPGLWLEHSFGWVPLMMDIESAKDTLNHLLDETRVVHVSRSAQGSKLVSQSQQVGNLFPNQDRIKYDSRTEVKESTTYRYRGDVVARAATTFQDRLARWGFTPSEFIPTAWEILPWSFLFDYFVSIGDFIDASFADTSALKWVSQTRRRVKTSHKLVSISRGATLAGFPAAANAHCTEGNAASSLFKRTTVRRRANLIPRPSLTVNFVNQSPKHIANVFALFGQANVNLHTQNPRRRNFRL